MSICTGSIGVVLAVVVSGDSWVIGAVDRRAGGHGGEEALETDSRDEMDGRRVSRVYVTSRRKVVTRERLVEDYGNMECNALCFHDLLYYHP